MARNILVINCDYRETRVALIENGVIAELQIERASARGTVGNIVLGKVSRVLPGMQAAFIDIGQERAAFLHVEDLIRPDDFEAYLHSDARGDADSLPRGAGGVRHGAPTRAVDDDDDDELLIGATGAVDAAHGDDEDDDDGHHVHAVAPAEAADAEADDDDDLDDDDEDDLDDDESEDGDDEPEDGDDEPEDGDEDDEGEEEEDESPVPAAEEAPATQLSAPHAAFAPVTADGDAPATEADGEPSPASSERRSQPPTDAEESLPLDMLGDTGEEEGDLDVEGDDDESAPVALDGAQEGGARGGRRRRRRRRGQADGAVAEARPAVEARPAEVKPEVKVATPEGRAAADRDDGRRGRRRRRGKRGGEEKVAVVAPPQDRRGGGRNVKGRRGGSGGGRDEQRRGNELRVSRHVPITEVVREGDEVIVQVTKEPIGTKGARVSSHVSLPGRYVVYLPTVDHVGISRRIGNARERARLREVIEPLKPEKGGLIVRTVAEGLTKKGLKTDVGYLIKLWADISRKREGARSPAVLYSELDLVLKTARDLFTDEIERIVIDDRDQFRRLQRFVEMFLPERVKDIELYAGNEPIFDAYGIEDEIARALSRKVPLASGGYLIIDQAEALTAIDVNTGRYVGKGSKDLEETALKTNLEAVEEIAYQLRFRNIGGLVILDLIDMEVASNREKVYRELDRILAKDKAKTTVNRISELGLVEMTRKRTRESLSRMLHEPCFYCDGTGQIMSRATIGYEILRQILRERDTLPGYAVVVNAHPAIVDLMTGEERDAVTEAERRCTRRIEFQARREYHIEQFDLTGK